MSSSKPKSDVNSITQFKGYYAFSVLMNKYCGADARLDVNARQEGTDTDTQSAKAGATNGNQSDFNLT